MFRRLVRARIRNDEQQERSDLEEEADTASVHAASIAPSSQVTLFSNGSGGTIDNDGDDARSVLSDAATFVARRYDGQGPRTTLPICSTLFTRGTCVYESEQSVELVRHVKDINDVNVSYISSFVPVHIPFTKTKTPYMTIMKRGVLLGGDGDQHNGDGDGSSESEELYCTVWQKIEKNEQIVYTLDFASGERLIMLNSGARQITEVMIDGEKLIWHGTPGVANTFGSGFFELKDEHGGPVALYYSLAGKRAGRIKKVGEFVVWDSARGLVMKIVAMGLALREQEQRKQFERNHIITSSASTSNNRAI